MHVKARLPAAYYLTVAQKKGQEGAKAELDWPVSPCMRTQHLTIQHEDICCNAAGSLAGSALPRHR